MPEILTGRVLSLPILESVCVHIVATATGGNVTDIRSIIAYVAEDTPLHSKQYIVTAVTTNGSQRLALNRNFHAQTLRYTRLQLVGILLGSGRDTDGN